MSDSKIFGDCPRCWHRFSSPKFAKAYDDCAPSTVCQACHWEFPTYAFTKHIDRLSLQETSFKDYPCKCLIGDAPSLPFREPSFRRSLLQKFLSAFGHQHTTDLLLIRQAAHSVLYQCVKLCDLYPAVPTSMQGAKGPMAFYRDPEDRFLVGAFADAASDADYLVTKFIEERKISRGEFRHIFETETLGVFRKRTVVDVNWEPPHVRGLVLATLLWDSRHGCMFTDPSVGIPKIIQTMLGWLFTDYEDLMAR